MSYLLLFVILFPMIAAGFLYTFKDRFSPVRMLILFTGAEFVLCSFMAAIGIHSGASFNIPGICGMGLSLELDGFRSIYMIVICFMWLMTSLFSDQYFKHDHNPARYCLFNLLTLGGTLGVFLSSDLFTTFIFFEMISMTSYPWVIHEENPSASRAASTYLAVAVIGGLTALMGLFMLHNAFGTLETSAIAEAAKTCSDKKMLYTAGACLLVGFGAKAGLYPLHIWLPKAHPVAPAPSSALLSGILTKCGIYGVVTVSVTLFPHDKGWGTMLLVIAVITMVFGALLGLMSTDLKRTLACSSMSQIGFITVGIAMSCLLGEHNALAARGAMLHMMNHSIFKLVLFMTAGTVYANTHRLDLNDIRGFGRKKPFLHVIYLLGALGIGGIPLFSGYISKTLLHESIVEYALEHPSSLITCAEWLFLFAGGLTLAYMTKLYAAIFIEKHPEKQHEFDSCKKYASPFTVAALSCSAALIPVFGAMPHLTMDNIAENSMVFFMGGELHHQVHYFNLTNLKGALISLIIGAAVYFLVVRKLLIKNGKYLDRLTYRFDLENKLYRPILLKVLPYLLGKFASVFGENKILTPTAKAVPAVSAKLAGLFADNRIFTPVLGLLIPDSSEIRSLSTGEDIGPAEEIPYDDIRNKTLYKLGSAFDSSYRRIRHSQPEHRMSTTLLRLRNALSHASKLITHNFSFSLLMICAGLCLLLLYMLFK